VNGGKISLALKASIVCVFSKSCVAIPVFMVLPGSVLKETEVMKPMLKRVQGTLFKGELMNLSKRKIQKNLPVLEGLREREYLKFKCT
jgi:hypothetical protein